MKIVVLDAYACIAEDLSFDRFKSLGELTVYGKTMPDKIIEHIGDADVVITNKCNIGEEVLCSCSNLRYIGVTATGYNIIDLDACERHSVTVCNVPEYSTNAVAQQVFAYILQMYNKVSRHDKRVKNGDWANCGFFCFYENGLHEISGKTIGIIGFGSIGRRVASLANSFDMSVQCFTRTVRESDKNEFPYVTFVDEDELFSKSDIVTVHCPLTDETKNLVSMRNLRRMKKNAIFINTARGGIVNEEDLKNALNDDIILAACVDVVSVEPIIQNNPLLLAKNIIITPHTAWAAVETRQRLLDIVFDNLSDYLSGNPQNIINK